MKLAQFKTKNSNTLRLGLLAGNGVYDIAALASAVQQAGTEVSGWLLQIAEMLEVIRRGDEALAEIGKLVEAAESSGITAALALDAIEFLPAVYPSKILAIGRNYVDHAIEGGSEPPAAPLIFTKLLNSLSAHNAPIVL